MSERFGPSAVRLYGIAARLLGWRPGDFWGATPAELASALADPGGGADASLGRDELTKMMEQDNG